ncbi:MAG: tRNA (adenosine(37)-N6)-dimethylallyltransferase MiaA [Chloroflexi bacterium]|nr:tRNA (adenosine(37)-N6)-dimethylallyltransferase MiaA [Chloroflexota bacterium]
MRPLVAIVGPTAVGKSQLALHLARRFGGEIVNADSRQVYRYMDIGTSKPAVGERSRVRHHLIDIIDPDQSFSLAEYQALAYAAINDIQSRRRLPVLVGGSGQYIWAVLEGWQIPRVVPNAALRHSLESRAALSGKEALFQELTEVDPVSARKIGPHNLRRIIRALEVFQATGVPISRLQKKEPPPYDTLISGLTMERGELFHRIDRRVDKMVKEGLVAEVEKLLQMGYDYNLPAMSSIGYRQLAMYLRREISLPEAIERIKFETHRYARQQYDWFRLTDKRIHWFDVDTRLESAVEALVTDFLGRLSKA